MPKFLVSMLGMNRVNGTRDAVEAVLQSTEELHLVLTNQNSGDGTREYFDQVKARHPDRVTVFHETGNTFFQQPNNRAFVLAARMGCKYFVALNDDAIIPRDGLALLAEPLDQEYNAVLSGPRGVCSELNSDLGGHGGKLEYIEGSCLCVKIEAIQRHWTQLWDPHLEGIYFEDACLSLQVCERGYYIRQVSFKLPHAGSQTVNRSPELREQCKAFERKNHEYGKRRWRYWLERRTFSFPLVIRRAHSLGDVILTTPIIRALRQTMPLCPIHVETDFPEVFDRNPYVQSAQRVQPRMHGELRLNFDMAYENLTNTHIVHGYEQVTREILPGLEPVELKTELYPSAGDLAWATGICGELNNVPLAILATDYTNWTGRNLPHERFHELAELLHGKGFACVTVGKNKPPQLRARNLCGLTSVHQLAALCSKARLFFGGCSGPLHIAQAVGCPTIGCFGVTRGRYMLTHRGPCQGIDGIGNDQGARHATSGQSFVPGSGEAIRSITTEAIRRAVALLTE